MLNVIERLDRKQFAPGVCVLRKGGDLDRVVERLGIPFLESPFTVPPRPYLTLLFRAWKAAQKFRSHHFALWHSFHYADDYTEPLIARLAGARVWMYTKKNMGWGSRAWRVRSYLANGIAVQNTAMIQEFFPKQVRKVRHIAPGVDTELFRPGELDLVLKKSWGFPAGTMLLGHVAQLVPIKNHPHLLRALARVKSNVGLLLAGAELDAAYAAQLRELAMALGIAKRVRFCGKVQDVPGFLRTVDMFVFSSHKEACPVAALEAMACGLGSVVTDIPAMRDIHVAGETGLVMPPEDAGAFASAIDSLADKPARRQQLGEAARRRVEAKFTLDEEARRYQELYADLLNCRTACERAPADLDRAVVRT